MKNGKHKKCTMFLVACTKIISIDNYPRLATIKKFFGFYGRAILFIYNEYFHRSENLLLSAYASAKPVWVRGSVSENIGLSHLLITNTFIGVKIFCSLFMLLRSL